MAHFVNIAAKGQPDEFIDIDDISVIIEHKHKNSRRIDIYSRSQGFVIAELYKPGYDIEHVLTKLREAGLPLIKFTQRWPTTDSHDQTTYPITAHMYFRTDDVSYIVSSEFMDKSERQLCSTLIGVRGYGRLESPGTTEGELNQLMDSLKSRNLMHIDPKDAGCQFYKTRITAIDPTRLDRLYDDPIRLRLIFDKEVPLSISPTYLDKKAILAKENVILNNKTGPNLFERAKQQGIDPSRLLYDMEQAERKKSHQKLIAKIIQKAPQLAELEGAEFKFYARPETILGISVCGYRDQPENLLSIAFARIATNRTCNFPDEQLVHFDTDAQAKRAAQKFMKSLNKESPAKKDMPKPKHP